MFRKMICLCASVLMVSQLSTGVAGAADPSLVGWWKLDDGAGTTAVDSSPSAAHGTLVGGVEWVPGRIGGALHFDGSTGQVDVPANSNLAVINQGDFSYMTWFNTDALDGANQYILQQMDGGGTGRTWFLIHSSGQIHTFVGNATTASNFFPNPGEWYHAACVVTEGGATDSIQIYIDGEPEGDVGQLGMETCAGAFTFGAHKGLAAGTRLLGSMDDVRIYNRGLNADEIKAAMKGQPELASNPIPASDQTDVPRDTTLSWSPGESAAEHDVYLGTSFDDVNDATTADAVYQGRQDTTSYDPGILTLGATYFWRIDEVNAAPDKTVFKGNTWNFTVEPVSYAVPIGSVSATASSMTDPQDPNNTVNGSGLNENDEHSDLVGDMWISDTADAEPWIQFTFEKAQKLDKVHVWNHNSQSEGILGFGIKEALVTYSADGETWTELGTVEIPQAPGTADYAGVEIALDGIVALQVKVTGLSNWSILPAISQMGLSEVRFYAVPVYASEPQPADGATPAGADVTLQWRAGREAVSHEVLLSSDANAVADGSAVVGSTEDNRFQTGPLDYGTTYFWRIVEVNEAETPAAYAGDIWSFTTPDYGVIDDMESYRAEEGLRIWEHWIDGFDNPDENGSVVGNGDDAEKSIVHGGSQSLPMTYNNNAAPRSEATRTFDAPIDLTASQAQGLVLYFHGNADNTGGRLYVKINDVQVSYDSDAGNLQRIGWNKWYIPIADISGTDLTRVTSLTLGVDSGGQGVVYVDDLIVTPAARELITPIDPGTDGLVSHYAFEGNAADSTGQNPGTIMGVGIFEDGAVGQAISFSGFDGDYVELAGYKGINADADEVQQPFSVALWLKTTEDGGAMVTWGSAETAPIGGQRMTFWINGNSLRIEHGDGNLRGNTICNDGEWHHAGLTVAEGANLRIPNTMLYIDGVADGTFSGSDNVFNLIADTDVSIGRRSTSADWHFPGALDEVMIYDRVLSAGEIAALAGRTLPFDRP
jgi:hypothetical protein